MKKFTIGLLIIIIAISLSGCGKDEETGGRSSVYSNTGGVLDVNKNEVGTTTPTYITAGTSASSTFEVDISGATNLALNWSLNASTTSSGLYYDIVYTNDSSDAITDYYEIYSVASGVVSNNITYGSWIPANSLSSTTFASIPINDVIADKAKIEYNLFGANGAVTLEVAAQ